MGTLRELTAYSKAFQLSMEIFNLTKNFPESEKFGLTNQMRKSSRSVCANLGEGYRKRQYEAHFVSKATDADMENTETQVWLDYSLACNYIDKNTFNQLKSKSEEVGRLINHMIQNPKKYIRS